MNSSRTARVPADSLDAIETAVLKSRRYADVAPEAIRRAAARALVSSGGDTTEAIKRTKRGLHEMYGAYLPVSPPPYESLGRRLRTAADAGDEQAIRDALSAAMTLHASTRERLPYLDSFYAAILDSVPPPTTICDLACGFNPLALPWMGRPGPVTYLASDIDRRLVGFVGDVLGLLGADHRAEVIDLAGEPLVPEADLTLLLKTVPCLERQQAGAGWRLIDAVRSPIVVVTFPTKSLGQRSKGMFQTYSAAFEDWLSERPWQVDQKEIPNELIYVLKR